MKKVFLHAGLHKTGTTAIQLVLSSNRTNLVEQNFYYPSSGIPGNLHGHHNIAWQLSRDRRFRPEYGGVPGLFKEIEDAGASQIILSSEDFESSLLHFRRFDGIIDYFSNRGAKVFFVIYLRRQADYLKSIYSELLKHGLGDEFNAFFGKIASTNKFEFKELEFLFNYSDIAKSLQSSKRFEVIFRDYDNLDGDDSIVDFCNVVGLDHNKLVIPHNADRINERLATNTLLKLFVRNRVGAKPDGIFDVVDELLSSMGQKMVLPNGMENFINQRVAQDLFNKNAEPLNLTNNGGEALNIGKLLSFETCGLVLILLKLNGDPARKEKLIEEWRAWVRVA